MIKNPLANAGGVGSIPEQEMANPLPGFLPGNTHILLWFSNVISESLSHRHTHTFSKDV